MDFKLVLDIVEIVCTTIALGMIVGFLLFLLFVWNGSRKRKKYIKKDNARVKKMLMKEIEALDADGSLTDEERSEKQCKIYEQIDQHNFDKTTQYSVWPIRTTYNNIDYANPFVPFDTGIKNCLNKPVNVRINISYECRDMLLPEDFHVSDVCDETLAYFVYDPMWEPSDEGKTYTYKRSILPGEVVDFIVGIYDNRIVKKQLSLGFTVTYQRVPKRYREDFLGSTYFVIEYDGDPNNCLEKMSSLLSSLTPDGKRECYNYISFCLDRYEDELLKNYGLDKEPAEDVYEQEELHDKDICEGEKWTDKEREEINEFKDVVIVRRNAALTPANPVIGEPVVVTATEVDVVSDEAQIESAEEVKENSLKNMSGDVLKDEEKVSDESAEEPEGSEMSAEDNKLQEEIDANSEQDVQEEPMEADADNESEDPAGNENKPEEEPGKTPEP